MPVMLKERSKRHPSVERVCRHCGDTFLCVRSRVAEGYGKYCSRSCYLAGHSAGDQKKKLEPATCQRCGKITYHEAFWAKRRKFCSRKCTSLHAADLKLATNRYTTKVCEHCHSEFQILISRAFRGKGRFCSRDCLNASSFRRVNGVTTWNNIANCGTSIENAIEEILCGLHVAYETQKPLLELTIADFFVEPDLVIFADGDYWHALPGADRRDQTANAFLAVAGYRVLRFSESRINREISAICQEIAEAIEQGEFYACP